MIWTIARDGDLDCRALYRRHYSYRAYADGRDPKLFMGPGGKLVLVTPDGGGLFLWRRYKDDTIPPQTGIECACFRRESGPMASQMILAAEPFAWRRWPSETRLYTKVDAARTKHKRDPGRCFLKAGWQRCGETKGGLVLLEKMR